MDRADQPQEPEDPRQSQGSSENHGFKGLVRAVLNRFKMF